MKKVRIKDHLYFEPGDYVMYETIDELKKYFAPKRSYQALQICLEKEGFKGFVQVMTSERPLFCPVFEKHIESEDQFVLTKECVGNMKLLRTHFGPKNPNVEDPFTTSGSTGITLTMDSIEKRIYLLKSLSLSDFSKDDESAIQSLITSIEDPIKELDITEMTPDLCERLEAIKFKYNVIEL